MGGIWLRNVMNSPNLGNGKQRPCMFARMKISGGPWGSSPLRAFYQADGRSVVLPWWWMEKVYFQWLLVCVREEKVRRTTPVQTWRSTHELGTIFANDVLVKKQNRLGSSEQRSIKGWHRWCAGFRLSSWNTRRQQHQRRFLNNTTVQT